MAKYKISGVWKDSNNVITHYAFHEIREKSIGRAQKVVKSKAIQILDQQSNSAVTWSWNYTLGKWTNGENVHVVQGQNGKFLRSNPDNTLTDNLNHLIDYDWISS